MRTLMKYCAAALITASLYGQTNNDALLQPRKVLTLKAAKGMAEAAEAKAVANGTRNIIAVVDEAGNLLYLERMDDATPGSIEVCIMKTRTAALFHTATKDLQDSLANGRSVLLKVPNLLPAEGALPILVDGKVIGAIGASGSSSDKDAAAAQEGLQWLAAHTK